MTFWANCWWCPVLAQGGGELVGLIPDRHGVDHGADGAAIDLLEMSLALVDQGRVDVEGHALSGEAERIQSRIGLIEFVLQRVAAVGGMAAMSVTVADPPG